MVNMLMPIPHIGLLIIAILLVSGFIVFLHRISPQKLNKTNHKWSDVSMTSRHLGVIKKAEKKLLEIRVRQCSYTIKKLEEEKEKYELELFPKIPPADLSRYRDHLTHAQKHHFEVNKLETDERNSRKLHEKQRATEDPVDNESNRGDQEEMVGQCIVKTAR